MSALIGRDLLSWLKFVELVFFPSFCELCSQLLEAPGEKVVCRSCLQKLRPRRTASCLCCGRFFDFVGEPRLCPECTRKCPAFEVHRSCASYEGILKDIIILFKYRKFRILDKVLADFVLKSLGREESLWWGVDLLVPVPLHPRREKERGFNQALAVARELSGKKGIKLDPHVLVRTRATPPQTSLEAEERKKNVRGAFAALSPEAVRGRTVLLVDDVFTTGSTLEECALTLRKAGAAEVRALTIAQA